MSYQCCIHIKTVFYLLYYVIFVALYYYVIILQKLLGSAYRTHKSYLCLGRCLCLNGYIVVLCSPSFTKTGHNHAVM